MSDLKRFVFPAVASLCALGVASCSDEPAEWSGRVVDAGNARVDILTDSGDPVSSYPLSRVVFSAAPLGEESITIWGVLGSEQGWTQMDQIRARPREKLRFRKISFDEDAGLAGIWEQNPEDYGSGNASSSPRSSWPRPKSWRGG